MATAATTASTDDALKDVQEKYAPGESYASESYSASTNYGKKMERIPEKYQKEWKRLAEKLMLKDLFARSEEVKRAADGGFYWRNIFNNISLVINLV